MKKYFSYIILASALLISIVAEYFSIFGISKLFSGAWLAAIFLAIGLGIAKLVAVTAIKTYWKPLSKNAGTILLRNYLVVAAVILILVTSFGTYGFLAAASQATFDADKLVQTRIDLLKVKRGRFKDQVTQLSGEAGSLAVSLENLRKSLSTDNQYQSIDRRTGRVVTQIQSTSKKAVQAQLDVTSGKKDVVDAKLDRLNDSITSYDYRILETEASAASTSELGPLKYLSDLTGYPMNKIVNIFMLLLVVVIDPLAIALVLTSQFAFGQDRWIRGVETRKKNKDAVRSPTSDDLNPTAPIPVPAPDNASKGRTRRNKGIAPDVAEPKKRGRKKKEKIEHFNVDIDPIADPDGTMQPVNTRQEIIDAARSKVNNKKSLTEKEIKNTPHEQIKP